MWLRSEFSRKIDFTAVHPRENPRMFEVQDQTLIVFSKLLRTQGPDACSLRFLWMSFQSYWARRRRKSRNELGSLTTLFLHRCIVGFDWWVPRIISVIRDIFGQMFSDTKGTCHVFASHCPRIFVPSSLALAPCPARCVTTAVSAMSLTFASPVATPSQTRPEVRGVAPSAGSAPSASTSCSSLALGALCGLGAYASGVETGGVQRVECLFLLLFLLPRHPYPPQPHTLVHSYFTAWKFLTWQAWPLTEAAAKGVPRWWHRQRIIWRVKRGSMTGFWWTQYTQNCVLKYRHQLAAFSLQGIGFHWSIQSLWATWGRSVRWMWGFFEKDDIVRASKCKIKFKSTWICKTRLNIKTWRPVFRWGGCDSLEWPISEKENSLEFHNRRWDKFPESLGFSLSLSPKDEDHFLKKIAWKGFFCSAQDPFEIETDKAWDSVELH